MSYYDEEFYHEPSEFDMLLHEFKESLTKSIKEEYIDKMNKIQAENKELQEVKANFEAIKKDYESKKHELSREYEQKKHDVRRERLHQLMKDFEVELYSVSSRGKKKPKCDKCDEKRRIYYTTPLGKETYEKCECDTSIQTYEPIKTILKTFSIRDGEGSAWYTIQDEGKYDEYLKYYDDSISGQELITDEAQFEDAGYAYRTLFKTKELAQKFCDIKNNQTKS